MKTTTSVLTLFLMEQEFLHLDTRCAWAHITIKNANFAYENF